MQTAAQATPSRSHRHRKAPLQPAQRPRRVATTRQTSPQPALPPAAMRQRRPRRLRRRKPRRALPSGPCPRPWRRGRRGSGRCRCRAGPGAAAGARITSRTIHPSPPSPLEAMTGSYQRRSWSPCSDSKSAMEDAFSSVAVSHIGPRLARCLSLIRHHAPSRPAKPDHPQNARHPSRSRASGPLSPPLHLTTRLARGEGGGSGSPACRSAGRRRAAAGTDRGTAAPRRRTPPRTRAASGAAPPADPRHSQRGQRPFFSRSQSPVRPGRSLRQLDGLGGKIGLHAQAKARPFQSDGRKDKCTSCDRLSSPPGPSLPPAPSPTPPAPCLRPRATPAGTAPSAAGLCAARRAEAGTADPAPQAARSTQPCRPAPHPTPPT